MFSCGNFIIKYQSRREKLKVPYNNILQQITKTSVLMELNSEASVAGMVRQTCDQLRYESISLTYIKVKKFTNPTTYIMQSLNSYSSLSKCRRNCSFILVSNMQEPSKRESQLIVAYPEIGLSLGSCLEQLKCKYLLCDALCMIKLQLNCQKDLSSYK